MSAAFKAPWACSVVSAVANSVLMAARSVAAALVRPDIALFKVPSPASQAVRSSVIWSRLVSASSSVSRRPFSVAIDDALARISPVCAADDATAFAEI